MKRFTLPAGTYFIGDPCYLIKKQWGEVCDKMDNQRAALITINNQKLFIAETRFGDGEYIDDFGENYSVDSGTIAVTPLELNDKATLANLKIYGCVKEFPKEFECSWSEGIFEIDNIIINTTWDLEEEEDFSLDYIDEDNY
jgi:hypothetical protein